MTRPQQNVLQHHFGTTNHVLYLQIDHKSEGKLCKCKSIRSRNIGELAEQVGINLEKNDALFVVTVLALFSFIC